MVTKKIIIAVLSVFFAVPLKAQLIKYVTYYPIPSVTHSQLKVSDKTMLATSDGGGVEVGSIDVDASGLVTSSFDANRVSVTSYVAPAGKPSIIVGNTGTPNLTETRGRLKVFGNIATAGWPSADKIVAQGIMNIAGVTWKNKGGFGFDAANNTDAWQGCTKGQSLMWRQIKMKGSDEYKTYLVCGNPLEMPEPVCDRTTYKDYDKCIALGAPWVVKGSPARQNCRCAEECTKDKVETEGGICCFKGQISRNSPIPGAKPYCTYEFIEENIYANAIVKNKCNNTADSCRNASSCVPMPETVEFYIGGNVRRAGQEGSTGCCGTSGRLCRRWKRCKNNPKYNKPHNEGWSGRKVTECNEPAEGQPICEVNCPNKDNPSCDVYCYKKGYKPSIGAGAFYDYRACYTGNERGCDEPHYTYGSRDHGKKCGDSFTTQAIITHCKTK